MPYIPKGIRREIDPLIEPLLGKQWEAGELNYIITRLLDSWCKPSGRYATYNAAIGILECVKQELYRRVIADYEDKKCEENGDVYD